MALIPESFVQDLLDRTDLVEVIDSRVPLKKSGRNYMACCPFHNEKTPSFSVAPDKQFYYCFGCGAKGNAIGFLMDYEQLPFPEAVKQLADKAGMEVPREKPEGPRERQRKDHLQSLYELLTRAERFYRQQLKSAPERGSAVNYLKGRGLTGEVAARYGLGFAPPGFDNLSTGLALDETGLAQALEAGLMVRREDTGRSYDKFRDRIMFPIRDTRGRTIGFGGRVLGDGKPKYLNSPETPVFHKGRELYGLWEWRQSRDKSESLFVVEGYMDVIALAQHGIPNCVATLGTATSEHHVHSLFRQVDNVVFCFDGDEAGRRAAWRALESTLPELEDGKQARFLFLAEGEDPDTLVRSEGREALLAAAAQAPTLSTFLFRHFEEGLDTSNLDGRARLARLVLPWINKARGEMYRSLLRRELAERSGLKEDELLRLAEQAAPRPATPAPAAAGDWQAAPPPDSDIPPPPYDDLPPPMDEEEDIAAPRPARRRSGAVKFSLAERLVMTLVQSPAVLRERPLPEKVEELDLPQLDLLIQVSQLIADNPEISSPALVGALMALDQGELLGSLMAEAERRNDSGETLVNYWRDGIDQLRQWQLEQLIPREERAQKPDAARLMALTRELAQLRSQRHRPVDQGD